MAALNEAGTGGAHRSRPWALVTLLAATATVSYLDRVNISVAGALLMRDLGLTQIQMGRVFSAFLLGYALFQVPSGMLADRLGPRRVLAAAAIVWAATTVLTAGAAGLGWLLAVRCLLGVGEAPTFPAAGKGISQWIPRAQQARANGLVLASIGLGSALAPLLLTAMMVRWGWRLAVLVTALPALAIAAAWLRVAPMAAPVALPVEQAQRDSHRSLCSPSFFLLTLSYTLQGYVGYIFVFWFYLYLVQVRHFDLLRSALLSSLPWIFSMVAIPLGGWLSDALVLRWGLRWGRRTVPLFGLSAAGLLLALGARTENPYAAAVSLAFSTACVLVVEGPFWATMIEIAGAKAGLGGGIMNMGSNLGGLISPALTPWLAAYFGWVNALYLAGALAGLAAVLWLAVKPDLPAPRTAT